MTTRKHITARQIVETRGVSHKTVMRMIANGNIVPAGKLPGDTGAYLFEPEEVDRAFAARSKRLGRSPIGNDPADA
jgi:hypothetical protein